MSETKPLMVLAGRLEDLATTGRKIFRHDGKQIALFRSGEKIFACNNRCPHEGYPLAEGSLSKTSSGCTLTCNWHNWKFDLATGRTLLGGDNLRIYPTELRGEEIWVDISDPPAEHGRAQALTRLMAASHRFEYDRMARELARFIKLGGDPMDAIRAAMEEAAPRFEFGMTHAHPAAADWLRLRETLSGSGHDDADLFVPFLEILAHLSWDTLRENEFPYPDGSVPFDAEELVAAIEDEDEEGAIALIRDALRSAVSFRTVQPALARAALAHYADFGHSAIYVQKAGTLIERLGERSAPAILYPLIRSLTMATREDLIPEFRFYGNALARWNGAGEESPAPGDLRRASIRRALDLTVRASALPPQRLHTLLLQAAMWQFLHFDNYWQEQTEKSVTDNVGWLDFTHMLTFAHAVRELCGAQPDLWPQGLLQMACFIGRNATYTDGTQDVSGWSVENPAAFFESELTGMLDHGQRDPLVAAHLLKTLMAARDEWLADPEGAHIPLMLAAVNRFLHSPLKRRHALRSARQALDFVASE